MIVTLQLYEYKYVKQKIYVTFFIFFTIIYYSTKLLAN